MTFDKDEIARIAADRRQFEDFVESSHSNTMNVFIIIFSAWHFINCCHNFELSNHSRCIVAHNHDQLLSIDSLITSNFQQSCFILREVDSVLPGDFRTVDIFENSHDVVGNVTIAVDGKVDCDLRRPTEKIIESNDASVQTALVALLSIVGFIGVGVVYFIGAREAKTEVYADVGLRILIDGDHQQILRDVEGELVVLIVVCRLGLVVHFVER